MPEVWLPPRLQRLTGGQQQVQVEGQTVRQIVDNLERVFPGIKMELYDEEEDIIMPGMSSCSITTSLFSVLIALTIPRPCFASDSTPTC